MANEIMENIVEETVENQEFVETVAKSGGFGKGLLAGGIIAGVVYGINKLIKHFKAKKEEEQAGDILEYDMSIEDGTENEDVTE